MKVGAYKLPGTLTIPKGKGPFPAVVLIQGSGPNDRDETVGANHPFADIADGLSSRGIIALRYDKRTYAIRNLEPRPRWMTEVVAGRRRRGADAASAARRGARPNLRHRAQPRCDAGAGDCAESVASGRNRDAGAVGPQAAATDGRAGAIFGTAVTRINWPRISWLRTKSRRTKCAPTQTFFGAPASYYYDLAARDEVAIARTLNVPILILHGSHDYHAIDDDVRDWQSGLKGDAKVQVQTLPSLNHLFMASPDKPVPADYFAPGHVDAAVIGTIASFIANPGRRVAAASSIELKASAIIVAAGSGVRLGSNVPKAFVKIAGRTMLSYSLATVRQINSIEELVITVPEGFENAARAEVAAAGAQHTGQDYSRRNRAPGLGSNRAGTHQCGKRTRDRARRRPPARDSRNFRCMPQRRLTRRRRNRSDTSLRHLEARRRRRNHRDHRARRPMASPNPASIPPRRSGRRTSARSQGKNRRNRRRRPGRAHRHPRRGSRSLNHQHQDHYARRSSDQSKQSSPRDNPGPLRVSPCPEEAGEEVLDRRAKLLASCYATSGSYPARSINSRVRDQSHPAVVK